MPFKSTRQRKFMHANHPAIAARWEREMPKKKKPQKPKAATKKTAAKSTKRRSTRSGY